MSLGQFKAHLLDAFTNRWITIDSEKKKQQQHKGKWAQLKRAEDAWQVPGVEGFWFHRQVISVHVEYGDVDDSLKVYIGKTVLTNMTRDWSNPTVNLSLVTTAWVLPSTSKRQGRSVARDFRESVGKACFTWSFGSPTAPTCSNGLLLMIHQRIFLSWMTHRMLNNPSIRRCFARWTRSDISRPEEEKKSSAMEMRRVRFNVAAER